MERVEVLQGTFFLMIIFFNCCQCQNVGNGSTQLVDLCKNWPFKVTNGIIGGLNSRLQDSYYERVKPPPSFNEEVITHFLHMTIGRPCAMLRDWFRSLPFLEKSNLDRHYIWEEATSKRPGHVTLPGIDDLHLLEWFPTCHAHRLLDCARDDAGKVRNERRLRSVWYTGSDRVDSGFAGDKVKY